jgi:hypothetical protein
MDLEKYIQESSSTIMTSPSGTILQLTPLNYKLQLHSNAQGDDDLLAEP